jgi:hypothetical protein
MSVIEIQLRDIETPNFNGNAKKLLNSLSWDNVHWLRKRRNELLHGSRTKEILTTDQQWTNRHNQEREARKAIKTMIKVFYDNPWV